MAKQLPLELPPAKPLVEFKLFEMRSAEPFFYMYGFAHAWGYRMTDFQARVMKQRKDRETWYGIGLDHGKAVKAGLKEAPPFVTINDPNWKPAGVST